MYGARIREARLDMDLTLDEPAERYNRQFDGGINKSTLSKYENEKQEPMLTTMRNLANVLNVTTEYLMGTSETKVHLRYDEGLLLLLETMHKRPELKTLCSLCVKATKEDVEQAIKIIEALRR